MKKLVHVTLLGKEALPVFYPIVSFKCKIIYVLGTKESQSSYSGLKSVCEYIGCEIHFIEVDPMDIPTIMQACEDVHSKYPAETKFQYNITGATKTMCIGAFIVAKKHDADIIYTDAKTYLDMNTFKKYPLEDKLDSKLIFMIQRQKLKSYAIWDNHGEGEKVTISNKIHDFIVKYNSVYKNLSDRFRKLDYIPNEYKVNSINYSFYDGELEITQNERTLLHVNNNISKKLLFEGRWWECLVADAMSKWSDDRFEIWNDVVFDIVDNQKYNADKNEVDILINIGNTFVFVECKSGAITQNELYKLDSVKQTYGSKKSKSVLVSFWPLKEDLKQKADDLQISVIAPDHRFGKILDRIPSEMNKIIERLTI